MSSATPTTHPSNTPSVGDRIRSYPGMEEVETLIRSKFTSDSNLLSEIPEYLLTLGGKRIRPALSLVTAKLCGLSTLPQPLLDVSAGIELIHMATLLHDDIIDRSPVRRGKQAPHLRYGEPATLLTGDFLLVRAFSLCSHLDAFIVDETEAACVALTEGEILEQPLSLQPFTLEESLTISRKKTAALFGLAAIVGAHIANASLETQHALQNFGLELGIAFQILDDVLDVIADEDLLGKKCGGDLLEQKPSVINVLWLESGDPLAEELLTKEHAIRDNPVGKKRIEEALTSFRNGSAQSIVEKAKQLAEQSIKRAEQSLTHAVELLEDKSEENAHLLLRGILQYTTTRLR